MRFQVNAPSVTYEAIDGEVVIINLDSGSYYSLTGVGAEVWLGLAATVPRAAVVAGILSRYDVADGDLVAALDPFVADLRSEGLLVEAPADQPDGPLVVAAVTERLPFSPPVMQRFTDMQDLLLLDPVHDVADMGWPHKE